MTNLFQSRLGFGARIARLAPILLLTAVVCSGADQRTDQQPAQDLPVVAGAAVPLYPPAARLEHVEGVVRLEVSTDGETVSKVDIMEGPLVLAVPAKENVKTWRLKWHYRTTFETTFRYKLLPEFSCDFDNPTIVLRLPLEVEVATKGLKTCDPSSKIRPNTQDHVHQ
jgi:hypothetical protein